MIKLILSDIDGTLLSKGNKTLDETVFEVIEKLYQKNIIFAAASGRSYPDLAGLFEPVKDKIAFVCSDGAYTLYGNRNLGISSIDKNLAFKLCTGIYETKGCELVVYTEGMIYAVCKSKEYREFISLRFKGRITILDSVSEIMDIPEAIIKIAIYASEGICRYAEKFSNKWQNDFNIVYCANEWMELVAPGVSKVTGLSVLLDYFGYTMDEVMAFGDGGNDVTLLKSVAYGYAMDYAQPFVKQAAGYETSNVMEEIKKVVLGEKTEHTFKEFNVEIPKFSKNEFNILDFGAVSGGRINNSDAINGAISKAAQTGGRVIIPNGIWMSGPIYLQSGVELHLEDNALLFFSKNIEDYPLMITNFEGVKRIRAVSQISAENESGIAITGKGIIDGGGDLWRPVKQFKMTERQWNKLLEKSQYVIETKEGGIWFPNKRFYDANVMGEIIPGGELSDEEALKKAAPYYDLYRPVMVSLRHCSNVLIKDVTFRNSSAWCFHPFFCEHLTVDGVTIDNPLHAQNGDGFDIESCRNVHIHHCTLRTGDDGICIKSGKDKEARKIYGPCENVYIHDCSVGTSHGGFVIGSEMSRGVKNILVKDCTFIESDVGVRIKSAMGRGGVVEDIFVENINMLNMKAEAIVITMDFILNTLDRFDAVVESTDPEDIPEFRHLYFKNINCIHVGMALKINGLKGNSHSIHDIFFDKFNVVTQKNTELLDCENVELKDSTITIG